MATILKLKAEPTSPSEPGLKQVVELIKAGEVVILPTETVYGLAADVFNEAALEKIFEIKKRSFDKPLAVLVPSMEYLPQISSEISPLALKLSRKFWPGPLTLVINGAERLPSLVKGEGGSVGVRCPEMELTRLIIEEAGVPLAATSANFSGQPSPMMISQIAPELIDLIALTVDGGPARIGVESTVIDLTKTPPQIIRPGAIERDVKEFLKTVLS